MKIKVIEVVVNGETKYLGTDQAGAFNSELVDHPMQAHDFLAVPGWARRTCRGGQYSPDEAVADALNGLRLEKDAWFAKSGLLVDACYTVEFEVDIREVDRKIGRLPRQQPH